MKIYKANHLIACPE